MPTYEYECTECGYQFEVMQNITAQPVKQCPQCKGKTRRLIGKGAGIISGEKTKDDSCASANLRSGTCQNCPALSK